MTGNGGSLLIFSSFGPSRAWLAGFLFVEFKAFRVQRFVVQHVGDFRLRGWGSRVFRELSRGRAGGA